MFGYSPFFVNLVSCFSPALSQPIENVTMPGIQTFTGGACPTTPLFAQLSIFLFGTASIVFSLFFPNYVAMFIPFAIALLGLMIFPFSVMTDVGVSPLVKVFIGGIFGAALVLSIIGWMKGNEM
jgi:hypothetical protein